MLYITLIPVERQTFVVILTFFDNFAAKFAKTRSNYAIIALIEAELIAFGELTPLTLDKSDIVCYNKTKAADRRSASPRITVKRN